MMVPVEPVGMLGLGPGLTGGANIVVDKVSNGSLKTGKLQGGRNPGESWRGGEGEGGDQNHHRTGKIAN